MFDIINNLDKIKDIGTKFKGLTIIGTANILSVVISGLFWFYIAALLGTTHYGEISYVIATSGLALTFLIFGAGNSFLVYIAKGVKIQPPVYFISLLTISIASVILYFIFYNIGLCLLVIGNGVFGLVVTESLGLKSYKKYAQYFIIQRMLLVVLAISLYHIMGYNGIIIGIGLSYFPAFIRVYQTFKGCSKIDFSLLRVHFRFMFTGYTLDITRTFATNIDKIIVGQLLGFSLLGNYQLGVQVLTVLTIVPGILYNYILPHDASGTENNKLKKLAVIFSIALVIPTTVLSPSIIPTLFPKFTEAISVIQIITISIIPITITTIYISKFLGNERIRSVLIGSGVFLAVQITTIFVLSDIFGVNGVAASYLLATTSEAVYLIIIDRLYTSNKTKSIKMDISVKPDLKNFSENIKLHMSSKVTLFALIIIGIIGGFLRVYNFQYDIPLILDAFNSYFLYATDVSILGNLPNWPITINGWPLFLSFFFSILDSNNFLDYMNLQRIITVLISILTIIPVYFLCRKFFNRFYSILGTSLFAFEPHLIQNSQLGLSEPLFIVLVTISITLFLSSKIKYTLIAFGIIGLATTIRLESIFVFFAFSIVCLIQNRNKKKIVIYYLIGVCIFVASLLPFILLRIRTYGEDFISSRILVGVNSTIAESFKENSASIVIDYLMNLESIVRLSGWSLIPYFVILIPFGIYLILKQREMNSNIILIIMTSMFIPAAIAFSWVQDTRYIYPLFPLLCIVSIFPIIKFVEKFKYQKILMIIIIGIILSSSIIYLEIKKYDLDHQRESFSIAQYIVKNTNGVNSYYPEDSYIAPAEISDKWPVIKDEINFKIKIIPTDGFYSLEKYIESSRDKGLSHLIIDDNKNRPDFLKDVFYNEEKYPYLLKQYDSLEHDISYHVKIFKIDYNMYSKYILNNSR